MGWRSASARAPVAAILGICLTVSTFRCARGRDGRSRDPAGWRRVLGEPARPGLLRGDGQPAGFLGPGSDDSNLLADESVLLECDRR
jgi:hypothetical protein